MRGVVIGYGRMGRFHHRALSDLGVNVTTVDPDPAAGADYRSVPKHLSFEVVCVAAPIPHLAEQAAAWSGHDGWLLIEKPMAASLAEAENLIEAVDGQRVAVGYVERFNPRVRELRDRLAGQPMLRARFTRCNDRPSPDVTLDLATHDFDLARHLGVSGPVTFFHRAGFPTKRRRIDGRAPDGPVLLDLTDHRESRYMRCGTRSSPMGRT